MRYGVLAILVLAAICSVRVASAQSVTDEADAAQHFERGVELYQEGSLDAALVEFERAYELVPSYRLLFNIAQVQTERHEYVLALDLFERYLNEGGSDIADERRAQVEEEMRKLRSRIAELWVETNVEGAELYVNDVRVGELPMDKRVRINPGICRIRIEASGYEARSQEFKVAGGEQPRLNLPLQPLKVRVVDRSKPSTPEDEPVLQRPNRTPFWVTAATTVALGGASAAFGVLALKANDDLDAELERFPADDAAIADAQKRVRTFAAVTDGLLAGTVVSAGLAIYFLVDPPMKTVRPADTARIRVVPTGPGAAIIGQF